MRFPAGCVERCDDQLAALEQEHAGNQRPFPSLHHSLRKSQSKADSRKSLSPASKWRAFLSRQEQEPQQLQPRDEPFSSPQRKKSVTNSMASTTTTAPEEDDEVDEDLEEHDKHRVRDHPHQQIDENDEEEDHPQQEEIPKSSDTIVLSENHFLVNSKDGKIDQDHAKHHRQEDQPRGQRMASYANQPHFSKLFSFDQETWTWKPSQQQKKQSQPDQQFDDENSENSLLQANRTAFPVESNQHRELAESNYNCTLDYKQTVESAPLQEYSALAPEFQPSSMFLPPESAFVPEMMALSTPAPAPAPVMVPLVEPYWTMNQPPPPPSVYRGFYALYSQPVNAGPMFLNSSVPVVISGSQSCVSSPNSSASSVSSGSTSSTRAGAVWYYEVEFKRMRRDIFVGFGEQYGIGEYVKVEADRGFDLGFISKSAPTLEELTISSSRTKWMSTGPFKRILHAASQLELQMLSQKFEDEKQVLEICRRRAVEHMLPMQVLDAEFQFDRHKLTFFFQAGMRIDFRELVRDLFGIFKTRIWLQQVSKHELNGMLNRSSSSLC